jgi:hypothetical protein
MRRILLPVVICLLLNGCGSILPSLGLHPGCRTWGGDKVDGGPVVVPDHWCRIVDPRQGDIQAPIRTKDR